jgi:site-specific DNA recombinase
MYVHQPTSRNRSRKGVKLEILEQEAATIRRMFELYGKGQSLKRIAYLLNAEGVKSPQPQKGRVSQSWCVSSVRHILRNRRYSGQIIWNTKRKVRVPGTGRRILSASPGVGMGCDVGAAFANRFR